MTSFLRWTWEALSSLCRNCTLCGPVRPAPSACLPASSLCPISSLLSALKFQNSWHVDLTFHSFSGILQLYFPLEYSDSKGRMQKQEEKQNLESTNINSWNMALLGWDSYRFPRENMPVVFIIPPSKDMAPLLIQGRACSISVLVLYTWRPEKRL